MEHPQTERLPDAEENQLEPYEKVKGAAQIHGHIFEYKFCALLFLRAKNKGYNFKLASNVKGLGAFDDVAIEYLDGNSRKSHIFVQLKSKAKRIITTSQLQSKDGDFSLRKYYDSYIQVENNFNCSGEEAKTDGTTDESFFIIYTNTDIASNLKSNTNTHVPEDLKPNKVTDIGEEEFLMTGGYVLQFNETEHKAIYEHLQDLPKHREFLSKFRIFYSQADEKEMECHIKRELQQCIKFPDSELDLSYEVFVSIIQNWWQNCSYFLKDTYCKENDPLLKTSEKVRTTLVTKILDQRKSELDDLSIKYKQSAVTEMEQLIDPNRAVLIFAPGRTTTLTAAKIHQMYSSTKHTVLNLQQFIRYKNEVMLAWRSSFDVLVLENQTSTEIFQDVADEISTFLNEYGAEKKFIFISGRKCNVQQIIVLRRTLSKMLTEEYDDWKFTDIVTESTKFLLEKKVTFQGEELKLKNLVKESDFRMLNALDCDSMSLLLANEKPSIGTPTQNTLEYYIDRKLESVTNFKIGIQTDRETLVQFREGGLEELQGTSSYREERCELSDNGQEISQFSLKNECSGTNTLERLRTKDQKLLRRQTTDETLNVQRGLERKSTKVWRPSTLLDSEKRIILVTDDPGMGKSTLLTHLAKQTQERHPDMWIVRVNINNYTSILHGIKTNGFDENGAKKLLTEAAQIRETEGAQLEEQLFNYIYNSTGNMVVLIDGVDEVSPHYTKEVIQLVKILSQVEIKKIWLTSRNSVKDQLEQELKCHSYSFLPFGAEDQKSFLVKFWNQKYSHIKPDYLEYLAQRVVELSSKHLSVREKKFMGIPLQSMLLAEMFEENLKQYSTPRTFDLPEYINIFIIYDLYVKKKWDIYLSEKKLSDRTNVNVLIDDDALYDIFMDNHKVAALMAILSTHHIEKLNDKSVLKKGEYFLLKIKQGLEKTGIITDIIDGRPVFLHRTFAEFFVARRLCDNILDSQVFMRDHLFESGFGVVRSMLDRILANKCPLHQAVLNSNTRHVARLLKTKESITQNDSGGRTPLHVAVSCRSPELIRLLLEYGADVSSVDTLLGLSPVDYAVRMDDWEMLSLFMEKRPKIREQVISETNCEEYIASALHAAAKYGHTDLLQYLISKWNCVNMVLPGDSGTSLHEAARGNHIQTVRTLVDLGANCDIQDADGKTALHVAAETGSLEVTKFIIERQEDELECFGILDRAITKLNRLNVRDNDRNTPLHIAAAVGNTSTVRYLLSAGSDLRSCNTRGEYPLTLAARYGRDDTVKLLLNNCPTVKCEEIVTSALTATIVAGQVGTTKLLLRSGAPVSGGENEKPIHIASRMGHKEIVSLLLQHGASLTSRTESGNTALHFASEAGHVNVVKYFVELHRDGMYTINYEDETPMHLAVRNGRDYLVTYFAENGWNINSKSATGVTCLHVACENGHYTTVERLLKHEAEVNAMNSAHQTPLHIAASRGQTKIVELLFLNNANCSLRDKDGFTALLAASINGHQDTVRFIVLHGGNIEDIDGKGNTIAHFAVQNENLDTLNFLSKQEANLEVQNAEGDTPLLKAVREGRKRVVQNLAEKQTDFNTEGKDGNRPLDVAILQGDVDITRLLLERNAGSCKLGVHTVAAARFGFLNLLQRFVSVGDDINVKADNGESPLHAACESGEVATVKYLCEHRAVLDLQDNNGNTALHVAAKGGYLNIIQYLADSFASIDIRNAKKETALILAVAERHDKIVSILIEQGAGIGVRDVEGKTALDIATEKGYSAITQLLNDRAEGRKIVCSNSQTESQSESACGNFESLQKSGNAEVSVEKTTQKNGADTEGINKTRAETTLKFWNHRCVLQTASENGNFEEVEQLVNAGTALDYGDTFGRTALWRAASRGHKSITRLLLETGSCVNIPDCEGMTPIETAAREGHWDVVDEFLEHNATIRPEGTEYLSSKLYEASEMGEPEVVRLILKCGISVNTTNMYGYTPLHVAANSGQTEILRIMLKSGANVNIADNLGKIPLMLAAEKGHLEIVRNLLSDRDNFDCFKPLSSAALSGLVEINEDITKHGASMDIRDENALTSLRAADSKEEYQFVRRSRKYGRCLDVTDKDGSTPLYAAALNGHVEIVRELLKYGAGVETANKNGWTPLNSAAQKGHLEVIRELLEYGATVEGANKDGSTSLYIAASNGYIEVFRELMKHGAKVETANKDGWTSINIAASNGYVEIVRELLQHGAKMDSVNNDGWTPLNSAAEKGHAEVIRELLKHGAELESATKDGRTPFYTAALNGHLEIVQELLKHGAKLESANNNGWTPLNAAADKGHADIIRELLKHGAILESETEDGHTPLYTAALNGHLEVAQELLKHGAKLETASKYGHTPLYTAVLNGHLEVVRELLKHGAKLESASIHGHTLIYTAVLNGHLEIVRELLKHGAKLESATEDGHTPLHTAALNGHLDIVQELLIHGAKLESANKYGQTPLYTAALNGHLEVVQELLKHGVKLESANNNGWTPLNAAAEKGHADIIRELLKHGANLENAPKDGCTPFYTAALNGHLEAVQELLKHGAKLESANNNGWTPLNAAADKGHADIIRELLKNDAKLERETEDGHTPLYTAALNGHLEVVQELLKHGAKLESASKYGHTPLYTAVLNGHSEVVRELLKHGAKLESASTVGHTPLYTAALNGHLEVVREMLKYGAKLEGGDKNGHTPLYTAALNGHLEIVQELLKHGAKLESANKKGWTPLNAAAEKGHADIIRELLKHGAKLESATRDGHTPLYTAALNGRLEVVRDLLNHGASVHILSKAGYTPLKAANERGHVDVVQELQKHGASM